jgi:hypothetical protein
LTESAAGQVPGGNDLGASRHRRQSGNNPAADQRPERHARQDDEGGTQEKHPRGDPARGFDIRSRRSHSPVYRFHHFSGEFLHLGSDRAASRFH